MSADAAGRRKTVMGTAATFVAGVLLAAFSPAFPVLLIARIVIGLAVGSASMVVPLYIGEVVPPRIRGMLVSLNQLAITSGILVSYLIDYGLSSSQDEARAVLGRLRDRSDIDKEIDEVRELSRREKGVREVLTPAVRPLLVVGVMLAVFQQITGINTVIYYAPSLLGAIGGVGVFFLFGFLTLVALGYFWRRVPETKGRSLQQIEMDLTSKPAETHAAARHAA